MVVDLPVSYKGNDPYVFISYSHADTDSILPIISRLQRDGYRVWFDEGIEVGKKWVEIIAKHLKSASCMIAFLTKNYLNSENCLDEIEHAKNIKIPTLIVYIEEIMLPDWFVMRHGRTQAVFCSQYGLGERLFMRMYESGLLKDSHIDCSYSDFVIENGTLIDYKGDDVNIVFPNGISTIGDCVFWQNDKIKKVFLPEGISHIGNASFCACSNLEEVVLPNSLYYIGNDAFFACRKLKNIDFPDNLSTIGENAFGCCDRISSLKLPKNLSTIHSDSFHGCSSLEEILLDNDSEMFCMYNGCLYDILMKKLYIVPGTKREITFPDGIKRIGKSLSKNYLIDTLVIPDSVEQIEDEAFADCTNLKSIILGKGVKSIGRLAFYRCVSLERIDILSSQNSITIHKDAFKDCPVEP